MGGSRWSDDHYADRVHERVVTSTPTFAHTAAVAAGTAKTTIHPSLDPKLIKGVREARDSDAHQNSKPVAVFFDVTGSMGDVPKQLQKVLPKLMGLLLRKGYITDPQILMGAIGDYHGSRRDSNGTYPRFDGYGGGDKAPIQVGQFESGIEMDNDLTNTFIEEGGGGQHPPQESYELAFYVAARKTAFDAFDKRGQKGYLFTIGDERPYPLIDRAQILELFGDTVEADLSTEDLIREVKERWEPFHIIPTGTAHGSDISLQREWERLLGQERVIKIDDAKAICEIIGSTIGLMEGIADQEQVIADLKEVGTSAATAKKVSKALDGVSRVALTKRGVIGGTESDTTERL